MTRRCSPHRGGHHRKRRTPPCAGSFSEIVEENVGGALAYFEKLDDGQQRHHIGGMIVSALARSDPERALSLARAHDRGGHGALYATALASIAEDDPRLALGEALRITDYRRRQHALHRVAATLGREDPRRAIDMLEQIDRGDEREQLTQAMASTWLRSDPDEALEWLLGLEENERRQLLVMAGQSLPQLDLDAALRWLPRLDEESAAAWRLQIASGLAIQRSAAQAQRFIARFEGTADYPELQTAAISGLAQTDVDAALRLARQLPPGPDKSRMLGNLATQLAMQDPQRAAELLPSIDDESARTRTMVMIAGQWAHADPAAAQRWVENLPQGGGRDNAVVQLASTWDEITPARRRLLESVDSHVRQNALRSHAYRLARTDPRAAAQIVRGMDVSDDEKQQMLESIANHRHRIAHWSYRQ